MDSEFLEKVEFFNEEFCSLEVNGKLESIALPFWSIDKIRKGLELREEWGISNDIIPFQGDWHELLCLVKTSGEVIYINDAREILHRWKSTSEFISRLSNEEVAYDTQPKLISAKLSPDLLAAANEFKKRL